jgi:hypothetical protein
LAELQRDMARLGFVVSQIREIEDARQKRLEQQPETGPHAMVRPNQGNCVSAGCDRRCGFLTAWRRIVGWILGPIPKNLS